MTVTQALDDGASLSQEVPSPETATAFDAAVSEFLSYLQGYRQYSPWTVGAYRIDLRGFREFLLAQEGRVPSPSEITRPQVVAWGLRLTGMKPLTIATLRSSDARSLRSTSRPQVYPPLAGRLACRPFRQRRTSFSFLQDMGRCRGNPARNLPLPKVARNLPTVLSAEQVQQLLAAAQTPDRRLLVLLLLSTGLRRSEAAAITLDQLDLEHRAVVRLLWDPLPGGIQSTVGSTAINVSYRPTQTEEWLSPRNG